MQNKNGDIARNILIGASSSIPYIGGIVSYILDKVIPSYISKQYNDLLRELKAEIEELQNEIDIKAMESEEFVSLCYKAIEYSSNEYYAKKRRAYKNIILNAITGKVEFEISDFFLHLIHTLSDLQFELLICLYYSDTYKIKVKSLSDLMKSFPENDLLIASAMTELLRLNLTQGSKISSLGKRFVQFINTPHQISHYDFLQL